MISLLLAACSSPPIEVKPPEPYWVKRSPLELDTALKASCADAVEADKPMLLAFSAPWCGDCNVLRKLEEEDPLKTELAHWEKLVIDVGKFDRHKELIRHYGIGGIAFWVALKPTSCDKPVTNWPVLKSGTFEPDSNPDGPRTAEDVAAWLSSARG